MGTRRRTLYFLVVVVASIVGAEAHPSDALTRLDVQADETIYSVADVAGVASTGTGGYADGFRFSALFSYPYGITIDRAGIVYVADHHSWLIVASTRTELYRR